MGFGAHSGCSQKAGGLYGQQAWVGNIRAFGGEPIKGLYRDCFGKLPFPSSASASQWRLCVTQSLGVRVLAGTRLEKRNGNYQAA